MNSRRVALVSVLSAGAAIWMGPFAVSLLALACLTMAAGVASAAARYRRSEDRQALARVQTAKALLDQGTPIAAVLAASDAAGLAKRQATRNEALGTLAWAALGTGYVWRAQDALQRIQPPHAVDLHCFAAVQAAARNPSLAIRALDVLRDGRNLTRPGAELLIDLYARCGDMEAAVGVALQTLDILGLDGGRAVLEAACEEQAYGPSVALACALFGMTCAREDAVTLVRALSCGDEVEKISRPVDAMVSRFRRMNAAAQARSLVSELRMDGSLPSGTRRGLDRVLRALEGAAAH